MLQKKHTYSGKCESIIYRSLNPPSESNSQVNMLSSVSYSQYVPATHDSNDCLHCTEYILILPTLQLHLTTVQLYLKCKTTVSVCGLNMCYVPLQLYPSHACTTILVIAIEAYFSGPIGNLCCAHCIMIVMWGVYDLAMHQCL